MLEIYRELKIPDSTFSDSGDYIIRVQTQFDYDEKIVNLVIQDYPEPPMDVQVENAKNGVRIKFDPGFNNYAQIESQSDEMTYHVCFFVEAFVETLETQKFLQTPKIT